MSKKITITNASEHLVRFGKNRFLKDIEANGGEDMDASDGYHTFTELYEHRIALFIALCRARSEDDKFYGIDEIWRSKLHSDGTSFEDEGELIGAFLENTSKEYERVKQCFNDV